MRIFLISILLTGQLWAANFERSREFPVEGPMRTRVDFWKKVYTEINTTEAFVHDMEDLSIIYRKVELEKSSRSRRKQSKKVKREIGDILRSIAKKNYDNLSAEEQKIADIVGKKSAEELNTMARNIRFQYGLRDRYYNGLIRSYAYLQYIEKIFSELELPHELTYLPHVESSFNYLAYSKVGAAGIWQFMRSTGKRYGLKVGYIVDDRRDPIKATRAAAQLLRDNYKLLQSWPLALTAYNHGARSISQAIKSVQSTDINKIIEDYGGRRFGFASKNFYATFMATVEISEEPEKYFKEFHKPAPYVFSTITLDRSYTISQIMGQTGLSKNTIQDYNPHIRNIAYRANLYLPRGFEFRVPSSDEKKLAYYQSQLKKIKETVKDLEIARHHIINRGETLYDIAQIYKVDMADIIRFNNIPNPSRIYAGMRVKIPGKKERDVITPPIVITKTEPEPPIEAPVIKEAEPKVAVTNTNIFQKIKSIFRSEPQFPKAELKSTPADDAPKLKPEISLESYNLEIKKVNNGIYEITIETEETLGHYAEWAKIKTQRIRDLNHLRVGQNIGFADKIRIPLKDERLEEFKRQRAEYHLSIQEDFYESYQVNGSDNYEVRKGDTLTAILNRLSLPFWLVRTKQPEGKLSQNLIVGQLLSYPKVAPKTEPSSQIPED